MRNTPPRGRGLLASSLASLALIWVIIVVFAVQFAAWAMPVFSPANDTSLTQALLLALESGLIALPLLPLARFLPPSPGRAAIRAWLLAAAAPLVLAPSRLFPPAESQLTLIAQVGLCLLLAFVLLQIARRRVPTVAPNPKGMWLAVALAAFLALPWLTRGALGSPLDTILSVALGLLAGVSVAQVVRIWASECDIEGGRGRATWFGGFVIGAALLIFASALAANGVQIVLMLALPALGWLAVAYNYAPEGDNWRPTALLIGLISAAAIALIDTDVASIIASDAGMSQAFWAALTTVILGWVLGLLLLFVRGRGGEQPLPFAIAALMLCVVAAGMYFANGQPGFYGDRLFVIMKDQRDVSQAAAIEDYDQRRAFVYQTLTEQANTTQADLRATLDRFGIAYQPFYLVNAVEVQGGVLAELLLRSRGDVDRILPSPRMRPLEERPEPVLGMLSPSPTGELGWNLTNIGVDRVWSELGVRGAGIVVGQSDSGAQVSHSELENTYRGRETGDDYNWLDPWTDSPRPIDDSGHGTHTLGTIVGRQVGIAPEAEWFACANLQRNLGNPALYLTCMQFMLAPYPREGNAFTDGDPTRSANVLNNSWGCPQAHEGCDPETFRPAIKALTSAGIFVVASAGNEGPSCGSVADPIAIYDESFTVGAVDFQNNLGDFSSVGPVTVDGSNRVKPDILAPGVQVLSALPGGTYDALDGTSMAGPHVAGVVALMWSANPDLIGDITRTRQILIDTATPFEGTMSGPPGTSVDSAACLAQTDLGARPNPVAGYGIVNAFAAVQEAINSR